VTIKPPNWPLNGLVVALINKSSYLWTTQNWWLSRIIDEFGQLAINLSQYPSISSFLILLSMIINSITHGSTASALSNDIAPFPAANPPLLTTLEEFRERFTHQNETFKFNPFKPKHTRSATTKNIPNGIDYKAPIDWFNLFYTPKILATITKHTNKYATYHWRVDHS
jgi:hypothetical protein